MTTPLPSTISEYAEWGGWVWVEYFILKWDAVGVMAVSLAAISALCWEPFPKKPPSAPVFESIVSCDISQGLVVHAFTAVLTVKLLHRSRVLWVSLATEPPTANADESCFVAML